jgi:hypothetical protein
VEVNKDETSIFPEKVRLDSAVQIKLETGEEKTFLITRKRVNGENILNPDDPFALQLLEKKKGDSIAVENGFGFKYLITVIGIKDIYTHAFHETLKLLETRFAGQHPIGVIHNVNPGAENDPMEQVIKSLTVDNKANQRELLERYNNRQATIGIMGWANRRGQVMQIFGLMSSPDVSLISFTRNEMPAVEHAIIYNIPIVLDLTSLITLFFIYRKQNLVSLLDNVFIVSQSTISELHACYEELDKSPADGIFSMGYEDGKLVGHMTPKETIQEHQKILKDIIDWCEKHTEIKVSKKQLDFKREERKKYSNTLGDCYFDTMLLAEEYQASVLSDDDNFKNLLRTGKTPQPFSTYELSHWFLEKGKMTTDDFDHFRLSLIQANYIFIPATAEILWQCFDANGLKLSRPFTTAVKGLIIMVPQACAQQTTVFLKRLYLANILATTREQILMYVFREVATRNDYLSVKKLLILAINKEFNLLPHFRTNILELLSAF